MVQYRLLMKRLLITAVAISLLAVFGVVDARNYSVVERASVGSPNLQTDGGQNPSINSSGQFVVFWSDSPNIVGGDTNGAGDIFRRDTVSDVTVRVNVGLNNLQTNGLTAVETDINDTGNLIVFASSANNLVPNDTNGFQDIFVHDTSVNPTQVNPTVRVSVGNGNVQSNGASFHPTISGNGIFVAFRSDANNIVPNDTNGGPDVFLYDRTQAQFPVARVNIATVSGAQANVEDPNAANRTLSVSYDGKYVAFDSRASNLVSNDTNGVADIFVRNRAPQTTVRVSVASNGGQANGASYGAAMSDTGRFVAFESTASNLVAGDTNGKTDIFLHDRDTDADGILDEAGNISTIRITSGNGNSGMPSINNNGRYVSFYSEASNLISGDTNGVGDIFVYDRVTGVITRVNGVGAAQPNALSARTSAMSADGRFVAFESPASNFVSGDTNGKGDIFISRGGPAVPTPLTATVISETQVDLVWVDNANDETSFVLQRSIFDTTSSKWGAWTTRANLGTNVKTFSDTGLSVCTEVRYRVAAQNSINRSPFSNTAKVTTTGCKPGAFTLLTPANASTLINPASLTQFTWSASREAIDYLFTLTNTTDSNTLVTSINKTAVEICDTTTLVCTLPVDSSVTDQLLTDKVYNWMVVATNTEGQTSANNNVPSTFSVNTALAPRTFKLRGPLNNVLIRYPEGTSFRWVSNPDAATYDLDIFAVISGVPDVTPLQSFDGLTPAADADGLTCAGKVCTLPIDPAWSSVLVNGQYNWTVTAYSPGGTPRTASLAPGVFSVNRDDIELLRNGGFETDKNADMVPDRWVPLNLTSDRKICKATAVNTGLCAFRFVGGVGETSSLTQSPAFTVYNLTNGDNLQLSAFAKGSNAVTGGRLMVRVDYTNSGLGVSKRTILFGTGTYSYIQSSSTPLTLLGPVAKITVTLSNKATSGVLQVDDVSLLIKSGAPTPVRGLDWNISNTPAVDADNSDGWIPLPPQP